MNSYQKLLLHPLWLRRRADILYRDKFTCQSCGCKDNLQVHHIKYESGLKPWEYYSEDLITLCSACHEGQHELIKTLSRKKRSKGKNAKVVNKHKTSNKIKLPKINMRQFDSFLCSNGFKYSGKVNDAIIKRFERGKRKVNYINIDIYECKGDEYTLSSNKRSELIAIFRLWQKSEVL